MPFEPRKILAEMPLDLAPHLAKNMVIGYSPYISGNEGKLIFAAAILSGLLEKSCAF
jgi:hypothetical protein